MMGAVEQEDFHRPVPSLCVNLAKSHHLSELISASFKTVVLKKKVQIMLPWGGDAPLLSRPKRTTAYTQHAMLAKLVLNKPNGDKWILRD